MSDITWQNKTAVWDLWQRLNHVSSDDIEGVLARHMAADVAWHGPHPINELHGRDRVCEGFWRPLRHSFPDLKRTCDVFIGGLDGEAQWVTATGYFTGTFQNDWLTIPATGDKTYIRFGQFCVMREGKIAESFLILDILAVMRQAGFQVLPPARGAEGGRVPPPRTNDGVTHNR